MFEIAKCKQVHLSAKCTVFMDLYINGTTLVFETGFKCQFVQIKNHFEH
jgi:hypothetical protein